MADLLSLGLGGLRAYRAALSAVGENVANAETPGFARRSVRLTPGSMGPATDPFYKDQAQFAGVRVAGIERAWDMFQAAEARTAAAGAGRSGAREQWLTAIETSLDDSPAGIGAKLTSFFNAGDALAATPDDPLGRSRMLMALDDTAAAFRNTADGLSRIAAGIDASARADVASANNTLAALANVNASLRVAAPGGQARAVLEDERDRLIDGLAERVEVNVTIADNGTARLDMADPPGATLLGTGETGSFTLAAAADGRLSLQLTNSAGTSAIAPSRGRFAGLVQAAAVTADRRAELDTLASDFAAALNAWSAAGRDESGAAGAPLLDAAGGAAGLRALVTDPARLAAASPDGTANGNLLALDALRGDTGAERRWTGIVAGHAQQLASARSEHAATAAWRDNSYAALDETTGVDLDREAADLLRYQQAYSAAARIVQVGRDTVDDILNLF